MLDLEAELDAVIGALARHGIEYAVCGGIAMAIHGRPRATIDIDLLIQPGEEERVYAAVEPLGGDDDSLPLDLLPVKPPLDEAWRSREIVRWREHQLSVISLDGLIAVKSWRGNAQDRADIARLRSEESSPRTVAMRIRQASQLSLPRQSPESQTPGLAPGRFVVALRSRYFNVTVAVLLSTLPHGLVARTQ